MVKLDWIEQWRRLGTTMVLFFCFYVATLILFPTASSGKEEGAAEGQGKGRRLVSRASEEDGRREGKKRTREGGHAQKMAEP